MTGNPGDGKTHLIERLRPTLTALAPGVIPMPTSAATMRLLEIWQDCQPRRRSDRFVLAINEWPLFALHRHPEGRDFDPLTEALRQVRQSNWHLCPPDAPAGRCTSSGALLA